uniref:Uncharacterized protein n=1 Tax=Molossus molossus TaxID=27622 RepID=A0A7J8EEM4_MOLMO|nr:hypothetical protein HJG59_008904 [Molossus molossus]
MWTWIDGSIPFSMHISAFSNSQLFRQCTDGWSQKCIFETSCKNSCGASSMGEHCQGRWAPVELGRVLTTLCSQRRGPSPSLQGTCGGLCCLTLSTGLVATRPEAASVMETEPSPQCLRCVCPQGEVGHL